MLLKPVSFGRITLAGSSFSTLYRVDAIEAPGESVAGDVPGGVSVPSIGSMLLKPVWRERPRHVRRRFSTLYRVDAIEALETTQLQFETLMVSVPSIGSMLLKPGLSACACRNSVSVSVPSIGSMLLKPVSPVAVLSQLERFSTLYRVDAIEAVVEHGPALLKLLFQYPLSGRCY